MKPIALFKKIVPSILFIVFLQHSFLSHAATADFDWSMPARFGFDADGDGLIDYRNSPESIMPPASGWRVDFNACSSSGIKESINYSWSVNGLPTDFPLLYPGDVCVFTHRFPLEGQYTVSLTVTDSSGDSTMEQSVIVQDWLIVAVGDSFGSGEGNPDIPLTPHAWAAYAAAKETEQILWQDYQDAVSSLVQLSTQATLITNTLLPNWLTATVNSINDCACNFNHWFACIPSTPDYNTFCVPAIAARETARNSLINALFDIGITTLDAVEEGIAGLLDAAESAKDVAYELWLGANSEMKNLEPRWQDRRCHRSAISGQAQAALDIENSDPKTSVTFVHLACSGAKITDLEEEPGQGNGGLLTEYIGIETKQEEQRCSQFDQQSGCTSNDCQWNQYQEKCVIKWLPPQMDRVPQLIGDREVDAFLVSIGGNDAKFAPIIKSCIANQPCNDEVSYPEVWRDPLVNSWRESICNPVTSTFIYRECNTIFDDYPENAKWMFDSTIDDLFDKYSQLADKINTVGISSDRVYLTEYPNATLDDDGSYCDFFEELEEDDPSDADFSRYQRMLPLVTSDEIAWADTYVSQRLNQEVAFAANTFGWNLVSDIFNTFGMLGEFGHGYCASDRYFVRLFFETFLKEMTQDGAVHPNEKGHDVYREKIALALEEDLYQEGVARVPESPPQCNQCHHPNGITTKNTRPVADAGPDQIVEQVDADGAAVTLDGSGSYDLEGAPLSYEWTWNDWSATGVNPTIELQPGRTVVTLTVSDGHLEQVDTCEIVVKDATAPQIDVTVPQIGIALQGTVRLQMHITDLYGIDKVYFFLRAPGGENGIPLEPTRYDYLLGSFNDSTGSWEYEVDTTQLQDGEYVIFAKAVDVNGNEGWSGSHSFSIRNWAVIDLLPASETNKAGRTMPVKFSMWIDDEGEQNQIFVYNENLEIRIYDTANRNEPMQTSQFGLKSTDYRIDATTELYITNFKTLKKPAEYVVEIGKLNEDWIIGTFSFETVR